MKKASTPAKVTGAALIVVIGLLNFHIPHFLIEATPKGGPTNLLELALLANVLAALGGGLGIYLGHRWGWMLGIVVASISVVLYLAQETVGLPGLPKMWLEPSRLVALVLEALFLIIAARQVTATRSS